MRFARRMFAVIAGLTVAVSLALVPVQAPASAADPLPTNCPDGRQIGSTAYVEWEGMTVASVKQYYSPSCRANWSYVYIWESFRSQGYRWYAQAWIDAKSDSRAWGYVSRRNWIHTYSTPVGTVNLCTRAAARIWIYIDQFMALPVGIPGAVTGFRPAGC